MKTLLIFSFESVPLVHIIPAPEYTLPKSIEVQSTLIVVIPLEEELGLTN